MAINPWPCAEEWGKIRGLNPQEGEQEPPLWLSAAWAPLSWLLQACSILASTRCVSLYKALYRPLPYSTTSSLVAAKHPSLYAFKPYKEASLEPNLLVFVCLAPKLDPWGGWHASNSEALLSTSGSR